MKLGVLELIIIAFIVLLIFGTRRVIKLKESVKKAARELKENMDNTDPKK